MKGCVDGWGNVDAGCAEQLSPRGASSASPVPQINKALAVPMSPSYANCLSCYQQCMSSSCLSASVSACMGSCLSICLSACQPLFPANTSLPESGQAVSCSANLSDYLPVFSSSESEGAFDWLLSTKGCTARSHGSQGQL
ncbi:unnamed protein product [Pleuronectes platessa]|uniref:Uncharacterized protein n=1 Tax=Pleuronectes platessa TaxID=8262 RepID=A0A9N7Z490_PLEPL|nr:unnamed protein product [Pleuronectes platessa]